MGVPALIVLSFLVAAACAVGAALRPGIRAPLAVTAALAAALCYALTHIFSVGAVLIHDPSGQLAHAALVSGSRTAEMRRLPGGIFYGEPAGDGYVQITCRNGHSFSFGYTSHGAPILERFDKNTGCIDPELAG